jgi:hypothetical protein
MGLGPTGGNTGKEPWLIPDARTRSVSLARGRTDGFVDPCPGMDLPPTHVPPLPHSQIRSGPHT